MCLKVFGIDGENSFQWLHGIRVLALQEENAPKVVQRHTVPRILCEHIAQVVGSFIVLAISTQNLGVKEMGACKARTD